MWTMHQAHELLDCSIAEDLRIPTQLLCKDIEFFVLRLSPVL